tara:strand:- start:516 stop:632 length:117 start_codon:yes stop_codon:yes gene_type:complete
LPGVKHGGPDGFEYQELGLIGKSQIETRQKREKSDYFK